MIYDVRLEVKNKIDDAKVAARLGNLLYGIVKKPGQLKIDTNYQDVYVDTGELVGFLTFDYINGSIEGKIQSHDGNIVINVGHNKAIIKIHGDDLIEANITLGDSYEVGSLIMRNLFFEIIYYDKEAVDYIKTLEFESFEGLSYHDCLELQGIIPDRIIVEKNEVFEEREAELAFYSKISELNRRRTETNDFHTWLTEANPYDDEDRKKEEEKNSKFKEQEHTDTRSELGGEPTDQVPNDFDEFRRQWNADTDSDMEAKPDGDQGRGMH